MNEERAGTPVVAGELTIIPVESICLSESVTSPGFGGGGFKKPTAVVVMRQGETSAFDMEGNEMDASRLMEDVRAR